jgi:hypothetical protein
MTTAEKINVDTYGTKDVPAAADFQRAATSLAEIQDAIDKRTELSDHQSTTKSGPVRRD